MTGLTNPAWDSHVKLILPSLHQLFAKVDLLSQLHPTKVSAWKGRISFLSLPPLLVIGDFFSNMSTDFRSRTGSHSLCWDDSSSARN